MLVLGFPDYETQAHALASALECECAIIELHRFPDGESRLRLPAKLPRDVVLCRSLDRPNEKLVELMMAAQTARAMGVARLILVAPYMCYMRQDTAFQPGEAVSQRVVGHFLAGLFDAVVTVDPHLHRVNTLSEIMPGVQAVALSAAPLMGEFLMGRSAHTLLVGPDQESRQWVRTAADAAGVDYIVAFKTRLGDQSVEIRLPDHAYTDRDAVLLDDVASTGRTLAATCHALREAGVGQVSVLVTHALFVGDALDTLRDAGITQMWSSDSVAHSTNAFALAPIIAKAVRDL